MRLLTRTELEEEMIHRITLRVKREASRVDRDIVALIAEMIDLSRERVPECYAQSLGKDLVVMARTIRERCERCGQWCGGDC